MAILCHFYGERDGNPWGIRQLFPTFSRTSRHVVSDEELAAIPCGAFPAKLAGAEQRSMGDFSWSLESLLPAATRREVCTCGATAFIICAWEPWSQVQVVLKRKIDRNEWRLFGCMYVNVQFTSFYIDSVWIESYASNWGDNCRTGLVPPSQVSIWPWRN